MSERYDRVVLEGEGGIDPDAPTPADGTRLHHGGAVCVGAPVRETWESARALSPVHAAFREGRPHPCAVSEWLWIVATAPETKDGWWPVLAFRIYAGFGTISPLQSTALASVEDWQPVRPGTPSGEKCLEVIRRVIEGKLPVRSVDPEREAQFFVFSRKVEA